MAVVNVEEGPQVECRGTWQLRMLEEGLGSSMDSEWDLIVANVG